jgi:DNA-binding PadR family transcriptional regulator
VVLVGERATKASVGMSLNDPVDDVLELTAVQAIVLGFAVRESCYGYKISARIEGGVCGSFVRLDRKAVYVILRQLEVLGCVTMVEGEQRLRTEGRLLDKRQRRWYTATPVGTRAYKQWIVSKFRAEPERVELLSRIMSASAVRPGIGMLQAVLDECQAFCDGREEALAALQALTMSCSDSDALCARLVLLERTIALRGQRMWIKLARAEMAAHEQRRSPKGLMGRSKASRAFRNGSTSQIWQEAKGEEQVMVDVE